MMPSQFISPPSFTRSSRNSRGSFRGSNVYENDYRYPYPHIIDPYMGLHISDPRGHGYGRTVYLDRPYYDYQEPYLDSRDRRAARFEHTDDEGNITAKHASGNDCVPFAKAMGRLHKQLVKASSTYSDFQTDYDNEMFGIIKYASKEIMDKLWVLRFKGERDPRTISEDENEQEDEDMSNMVKMDLCRKKTEVALQEAVDSTVKTESKIRAQAANHLKEKVETSQRQITKLMKSARDAKVHCTALLIEIEELKNLVDPENERNRKLFKAGNSDSDEEPVGVEDEERSHGRGLWES